MNTFEFALDLSKQTAMEPLRLRQGDKNGTEVRATIYDHGTLVSGSYTSRICLGLPDGTHYYRKAGTFSAGVATVTIDEQEAASVVGRSYGYIQLLSGSTVIASTASFPVLVLPDATADATVPESYDTAIQEAIDGLNEAVADLPETVEDILEQHHEWTTTVQDNSLTDAKLIQSGGILSRNARLMYRLANLLTHRTDEGTLAAISDAAKTPMAGLSVYGQSTQDGTPTPSAPVPIVSVGGNLLDVARSGTRTDSGLTWTYNTDGTVTANGTATGNSWSHTSATETAATLPAGTYTASVSAPFGLVVSADGTQLYAGTNSSYTFTLAAESSVRVYARATSGTVYSGETTGIMLVRGSIDYPYVPYGHAGLWARRTSDASVQTVTPIDLDGHELRSLPDGTRDELTVDAEGNVTLVQRVEEVDLGTLRWSAQAGTSNIYTAVIATMQPTTTNASRITGLACAKYSLDTIVGVNDDMGDKTMKRVNKAVYIKDTSYTDPAAFEAAMSGVMLYYPLATPVTHDLGTVPLVPLVGPDLTAQTVPTAPFVLDAERDLNVTLARLEAAIAALA